MIRQLRRLAVVAAVAALLPALASAQEAGRITGRVVDAATQQPIPEAQIFIVGTTRGARTNVEGRYTIPSVPAGAHQVRVLRLGYEAQTQPVTVAAGQEATVDFSLGQRAAVLEGVVTTATGEQIRMRETGNSVAAISVDTVDLAPIQTFSQLVTGRAAGVSILQSGGTTGTGTRVRIRGANSVSLSNEPLLIIDGVRVNNDPNSNSLDVGGQVPSRLNDLNPEDIESIEVLKGPAATGLYGTQAANGVIQVRTKRGRAGKARWTAFAEAGNVVEPNSYPANYGGRDAAGDYCDLYFEAYGVCTVENIVSFNPLEQNSPFRTGMRRQFGVSVSGGQERLTYYLAADQEEEEGVYRTSELGRTNLRANLSAALTDDLDVTVASGYLSSDLRLPQNDNNFFGYISNGLAGTATPTGGLDDDGYDPIGPSRIDRIDTRQEVGRFTSSVQANYRPLGWLSFTGVTGLDIVNRFDHETFPIDVVPFFGLGDGYRASNRINTNTYTGQLSANAVFSLRPDLTSTTTLGYQYQRELSRGTYANGYALTPGTIDVGNTSDRFGVDESYFDNKTTGALLQQQLGWRDRLFVSAAIRGDKNSAFGATFGTAYYPSASVSYVISDEAFFPQTDLLSSLRLRAAYGQSGLRPGARDAVTYYDAVSAERNGISVPAVTIGGLGDPTLKPERTSEYELGTDISMLDERVRLELTYYNKESQDALIRRRLAPSAGLTIDRFENIGAVSNVGFEALLGATLVDSEPFVWAATLTGSWNRNRLDELGADVAPIVFGVQRHVEGYSLGAYWARPILGYDDANGDGIIAFEEVVLGDEPTFIANSIPTRQLSLSSEATVFRFVKVSALADYRGGYSQFNSSENFRCGIGTCRALVDRTVPREEQVRGILAVGGAAEPGVPVGQIEEADFVKLREVALTLTAPETWASRMRVGGMSLTFAGRNLGLWTDYSGVDPEVNVVGQANFTQQDFLSQPQVRYYTARLNVTF